MNGNRKLSRMAIRTIVTSQPVARAMPPPMPATTRWGPRRNGMERRVLYTESMGRSFRGVVRRWTAGSTTLSGPGPVGPGGASGGDEAADDQDQSRPEEQCDGDGAAAEGDVVQDRHEDQQAQGDDDESEDQGPQRHATWFGRLGQGARRRAGGVPGARVAGLRIAGLWVAGARGPGIGAGGLVGIGIGLVRDAGCIRAAGADRLRGTVRLDGVDAFGGLLGVLRVLCVL